MNTAFCSTHVDEALENGPGFYLGLKLRDDELKIIRDLVENQWLSNIHKVTPINSSIFSNNGLEKYHENDHLLSHALSWPKATRILPKKAIDVIRATSFFKKLEEVYGAFDISDEEDVGYEEIYWRLVRPKKPSDVGPLHADSWFWDLGHGKMPANVKKRVKVWLALFCEPGLNGLRLVPESQKKEWRYRGEYRDGFSKPQIEENEADLTIELAYTKPGDAIIFHDKLLHGGAINQGESTRVSIEFTIFVKADKLDILR